MPVRSHFFFELKFQFLTKVIPKFVFYLTFPKSNSLMSHIIFLYKISLVHLFIIRRLPVPCHNLCWIHWILPYIRLEFHSFTKIGKDNIASCRQSHIHTERSQRRVITLQKWLDEDKPEDQIFPSGERLFWKMLTSHSLYLRGVFRMQFWSWFKIKIPFAFGLEVRLTHRRLYSNFL